MGGGVGGGVGGGEGTTVVNSYSDESPQGIPSDGNFMTTSTSRKKVVPSQMLISIGSATISLSSAASFFIRKLASQVPCRSTENH